MQACGEVEVTSLSHLATLIDSVVGSPNGFLELELFNTDRKLVIETDLIREAQAEILTQHKISLDRYIGTFERRAYPTATPKNPQHEA